MILDFPVYQRVLIYLFEHKLNNDNDCDINVSMISRDLIVTYSHIHIVIDLLVEKKLVTIRREGRTVIVNLTYKGRKLSRILYVAYDMINSDIKVLKGEQ